MTREELTALGLTDEQVNGVMKAHGLHIAQLQNDLVAAQGASTLANNELAKYKKGGDKYIDRAEFDRLKAFETETVKKEANGKKTAAINKLFAGANASESVAKLFIKGTDLDKIELDDKGEVKGGAELLKQAKADFADLFGNGNRGVPNNGTQATGGGDAPTKLPVVF